MQIKDSKVAESYLRRVMGFEQEEFWGLCLTSKLELISVKRLFLGTVDRCLVHPRDLFRYAMLENATKVLVAHSHPFGGPEPSSQDREITLRFLQVGRLIGIPLVDHLVVAKTGCYSFLEREREMFLDSKANDCFSPPLL